MQPLIVAQQLAETLADFLRAMFPVSEPAFGGLLENFLAEPGNLLRGPYLTLPLPFRQSDAGHAPYAWLPGFRPYAHQLRAFRRLDGDDPRPTLIATGTGSGKTECFLYPVLDHCLRQRAAGQRGIKAVILYPMNALAGDQAGRFAKAIVCNPALGALRVGLYIGDQPAEASAQVCETGPGQYSAITDRHSLRAQPPDILLTNYKMLDFLLLRAEDGPLWAQQRPDTLRYLVVDELHTFDGAQGTDLACLIRRLKARLDAPPGQIACVGTSATLGDDGSDRLCRFASDVFGETFDEDAVIGEQRVTVGEYLAAAPVEYTASPAADALDVLDPARYDTPADYLAAVHPLWFGGTCTAAETGLDAWRQALGTRLQRHYAFQNLLRDLDRHGAKSVAIEDLLALLRRRLVRKDSDDDEQITAGVRLWLTSLLALVAHARTPGHPGYFLQVKVELWLRELRRMVAPLSDAPVLRHGDDLGRQPAEVLHLPVIHCRDCHATGWGATQPHNGSQLSADLRGFYTAFFGEEVSTRFLFLPDPAASPRLFTRQRICPACGWLHPAAQPGSCNHCGHAPLLELDVTANLREKRRNQAAYQYASHDCPYCGGDRTLTIVGSQAASLAAVMVGHLFSTRYNHDRKLIAFSDSVQDAAHRAGFIAARTWRLMLRPALAQSIAAAAAAGAPLTLAELPAVFEREWRARLGDAHYCANFLPPRLHWLREMVELLETGTLAPGSTLPKRLAEVLPWAITAEFGQDAHIGRSLIVTGTACIAPDPAAFARALQALHAGIGEHVEALRGVTAAELRVFLLGLTGWLQRIGAWREPGLALYARVGCKPFAYRNNVAQFEMLKSPRPPRFLSLAHHGKCCSLEGDGAQALYDWAFRSLAGLNAQALGAQDAAQQTYRLALEALREAGLAGCETAEGTAGLAVWGLEPAAWSVLPGGRHWRCSHCRNRLTGPPLEDYGAQPCRRTGCQGRLEALPALPDFHRRLYLQADIHRVVAHEHTGLLPRETRERIEQQFRSDDPRVGALNLLSATPTLEMGIDIGELSATLLCSVPPRQASYIQRVGRAGRRTGNALLLTLATSRPHDLYFWADPRAMLAGSVRAPGVFLNASAVLERQLTAWTLDCWVRAGGRSAVIAREIRAVLSAVHNQSLTRFPYPWLDFIERQRAGLLDRFVALFQAPGGSQLDAATQAWLAGFIAGDARQPGSLAWKILDRLLGLQKDVDELRRQRERLERELERLQALPAPGDHDREELAQLSQERSALARLIGDLLGRATLNVLTDEGLLPNYAFPEQGVLLRSIILREDRPASAGGHDAPQPLTFEYERPGASAITELAPNNTFYAEGRRVTISQVDVSRLQPQTWRFCRQCSYAEPDRALDCAPACPRCGDPMWRDTGRRREMLKLSSVYARTTDRDSRIADDSDERQRGFYVSQALIDTPPEAVREAWALDPQACAFGFEFLDQVQFREINCGERSADAASMTIAGSEQGRPGFLICPECGTLQRRRSDAERHRNHTPYCSRRRSPHADAGGQRCVFLYREFASEGIRMSLPGSGSGEARSRLLSFIAALQFGLERRFHGAVDHLHIAPDVRMAAGQEIARCYLVIYDSVPGGTGYLKELMRAPQPLLDVLADTLQALDACACNQDPGADGCYRCLYAYRNNHDREHVSRRLAQQMLGDIVRQRASLRAVENLASVPDGRHPYESVLESNFVEALRRTHDGERMTLSAMLFHGKPCHQVQAGNRRWRLEPQVSLGAGQGVCLPCRPDFVFWPDDGADDRPVAVFLDGWQFHRDVIADDLAKRTAIARSGRFSVWTLSWDDVESALGRAANECAAPWALLHAGEAAAGAANVHAALGLADSATLPALSPFLQLHRRLRTAGHAGLGRVARALALRMLHPPGEGEWLQALRTGPFWQQLEELDLLPATDRHRFGVRRLGTVVTLAAGIGAAQLTALLGGSQAPEHAPLLVGTWAPASAEPADESELRLRWRQLWQALNWLLLLPRCWVGTPDMPGLASLRQAPDLSPGTGTLEPAWVEVLELVAPDLQPWIGALAAAGVPWPVVGHELPDARGCVLAEAELAWPALRIAVLLAGAAAGDETAYGAAGWRCTRADTAQPPASLIAALKESQP